MAYAAALDASESLRKSQIESTIRQLTRPARGAGWALGIFDAGGDLREYAFSGFQINRRRALEMLAAMNLPEAPGLVNLKVTGSDGKTTPTLGASILLEGARGLVLFVTRPPTNDTAWSRVAHGLQAAVRRIAALVDEELPRAIEVQRTRISPRPESFAFFLVSRDQNVAFEWYPKDAASTDFADLVTPHEGRLPALLERAVRRLIAGWDFSRIETCRCGSATPVPGLLLMVAPIRGAKISIGVFIEWQALLPAHEADAHFRISPREREVLHALFDGHSVAEIAAMLNLAPSTVNDHIERVIVKTNSHNRVEMTAMLLGWRSCKSALPVEVGYAPPRDAAETDGVPRRVSWRYRIIADTTR
ncbi:MAG TPA: helix-turn-helix transcriptional regulator [Candidatus Cybelea sp.]|jgi:DNA-binding CsgD family transcriptional regulator|nr:helix-turn-helix transcriptional regulator [Candidatus Cybelea sp.]